MVGVGNFPEQREGMKWMIRRDTELKLILRASDRAGTERERECWDFPFWVLRLIDVCLLACFKPKDR